ncbi:MAG: pyruvate ferredoxin oxidoreductase [Armatimonadia bacterium]|nr:pyruvate ferredoxin oxidoreductase [Armatimonadia bacterium]
MASLKELSTKQEGLVGGHRLCAGCGAPVAVRQILLASEYPVVVGSATGCLEVATTIFPYTSWDVPFIHSAFENVAATVAGIEACYRAFKRQGKMEKKVKFIAFGGDGGTYDIGLQSLSGALERGHDLLYVCYDNGAYMNTGIQRSSATPRGAATTTSPAGSAIPGKQQRRKNLTEICAAHGIAYAAQSTAGRWQDLTKKAAKAIEVDGPSFLNVLAPCPRGWRYPTPDLLPICKVAHDTCYWPLYEIEDGKYTINYKPKEKLPIEEFLKPQGRFRHLMAPGNEGIVEQLQADVDAEWDRLLVLAGEKE